MLNMDFAKRVVVDTAKMEWTASPAQGVWRKPLEREAKESGHTTSIVRYAPGSRFSEHPHPLGEEILVLEGVFSDEHGDYPAGTYLRNPPGSHHSPFSLEGCVILVKLNQFEKEDLTTVRINTKALDKFDNNGGSHIVNLHDYAHEHVSLLFCPKGERFQPPHDSTGIEIFVLSGGFKDSNGYYPESSWLRLPRLESTYPPVDEDTVLWVKTRALD
ncbi:cupin domain-containing protein [Vibrio mytili]|uniref:Cupin n=1 Tax=Vibrio mytili TaxID=50718 RepID=A0A0C3DGP6_9VIBR|nr:cupin domain-containing protein [Vibrio mytili]KIN10549.1 cupin [Vibrio mytili]